MKPSCIYTPYINAPWSYLEPYFCFFCGPKIKAKKFIYKQQLPKKRQRRTRGVLLRTLQIIDYADSYRLLPDWISKLPLSILMACLWGKLHAFYYPSDKEESFHTVGPPWRKVSEMINPTVSYINCCTSAVGRIALAIIGMLFYQLHLSNGWTCAVGKYILLLYCCHFV